MTADDVADELYGLDPSDFVATRTERQKQAKADGDKALAKEIGALRKPTTVGWVLNILARSAADEVGDLLDLGEALREAQQHLSGATLRTLTKQRQRAVRALADRAGAVAADLGKPVGDDVLRDVTQTLNAALSDPEVADTVRRGRVLGVVEYSGFGPMGLVAVDDLPQPHETQPDESQPESDTEALRRDEERARAQTELDDAQEAVETANDVAAEADRALATLREIVDDLERRLDTARTQQAEAERVVDTARAEAEAASTRVTTASKRLGRL